MRAEGTVGGRIFACASAAFLAGVALFAACSDSAGPNPPPPPPSGLIVSNPIPLGAVAIAGNVAASRSPTSPAAADSIVYVSLTAGTVPGGTYATIRRVGSSEALTNGVRDGGFDPVAIGAQVGDSILIRVTDAGGITLFESRAIVTSRSRPVVVRTDPPPRKRDVPLNAAIVVVFSEPVAGASLSPASVQLRAGQSAVSGTVRFVDSTLDATHVTAEFVPDAPLGANTDYHLIVTRQIRDVDGDTLAAPDTATFTTGASVTGPPASVQTSPDSELVLLKGASYQLSATVRDAAGNVLTNEPVAWSSSDPSIVVVSPTGRITGVAEGIAQVTASVGGPSDVLGVRVYTPPGPPASVSVTPPDTTLSVGSKLLLRATVQDSAGHILYPVITWSSSDPSLATVDVQGFVSAVHAGAQPATITATSGDAHGVTSITVKLPPVIQGLSAGGDDTCGLTSGGAAYCWGSSYLGELLDGSAPVAVSGGLSTIATGSAHSCGLTSAGAAYCWGDNGNGELGDSSTTSRSSPVAVAGGLTFSALALGWNSCGLSAGSAYCWGNNLNGLLGNDSLAIITSPLPVSGGLVFSAIATAWYHTCGLTGARAAYCWGDGGLGMAGNGVESAVISTPVAVIGGLSFSTIALGAAHTCGLTIGGAAYCWGSNYSGQLGTGTTVGPQLCHVSTSENIACSSSPVAVVGGLSFSTIALGGSHTCGLTINRAAYCWGSNDWGQLGNGSKTNSSTPVAVSGGLTFSALALGGGHSCGLTNAGAVYCWGANNLGQVGGYNPQSVLLPVLVVGWP